MSVINGNNVYIGYLSGGSYTIIAGTKSNEINVQGETIEIASATQQQWREFIAGRKEWTMSVSFLLLNLAASDPTSPLNVLTSYTLRFMTRDGAYIQGTAICTQCKLSSARGNLVNGTVSFKGTGALT